MGTRSALGKRVVIIGEAPNVPPDHGPVKDALIGYSGMRLCKIADWEWDHYLSQADRFNLFDTAQPDWNGYRAEQHAAAMFEVIDFDLPILLLGQNVARAFFVVRYPLLTWLDASLGEHLMIVPHPSGMNRFWNDLTNVDLARSLLHGLIA